VALVAGVVAGVLEAHRGGLASNIPSGACAGPEKSAPCAELQRAFDQRTAARNVALVAGGLGLAAGGTAIVLHFAIPAVQVTPAGASLTVGGWW